MVSSSVYFGSMQSRSLAPEHSFAAKFTHVVEKLGVENRVKDKSVLIKMHLGVNVGFSTVNPFLVRLLVSKIQKAGGNPFIADSIECFRGASSRGYTQEVVGCPVFPIAGPTDNYFVKRELNYKNVDEVEMGGLFKDAEVLVTLSHAKGHNTVGFGGAIKNLALGGFTARTRSKMHTVMQYDKYWSQEKCGDPGLHVGACPYGAISISKKTGGIRIDFDSCNQCRRCVEGNPHGCLEINPANFQAFQELMALTTREALANFGRDDRFFISVATDIMPVCDCWGITTGSILDDLGVLGSTDPVALDKATLDMLAGKSLITENVPQSMEIIDADGLHPFQRIHGPYKDPYGVIDYASRLGLGSREYAVEEVIPQEKVRELSHARFPKPAARSSIKRSDGAGFAGSGDTV